MSKKFSSGLIVFAGSLIVTACNYFEKTEEKEILARVNETYLYKEDIEALVDESISPEDSAIIVNNYITRWATQQLLIDRAKFNLSTEQQEEFDELVKNYKNELYTKAYADALVAKKLDTSLNLGDIEEYYKENKESFKLNEDLVKLRFISLDKNVLDFQDIKKKFIRFNEKDKAELDETAIQFKNYSFNDSVWVGTKSVFSKIGPLNDSNKSQLLKKSNFLQLEDSLEVYLIYVNDVLLRNEQAPLEYANSTIKQILLNKRKAELVKELEKDITRDAIENEQFKIYN
ncbi:peptidyl-prolyl cis-trans isomerase [Antarcticibacterium sp. 1MA-6-2]|uniref:peptidyl-prolyl cis-trans isomerase n=1 Tax=Antarcticibacterium sp. 1MA-6-2 TaxID=2908210 RepID=UPI001F3798FB|nr:peptidyl-prolyl cis-trans isomerase [Antarcticibacterium sp. 1MA-6-2]UJH91144.1 peptidyl-prolyl cis-trans isomerase [Antarcticibacterium sp. 1MA-6-2]